MIELKNVYKSYGAIKVLMGINLKVAEGECLAVNGRSGSGKTTLLKIMGTLAMPSSGSVIINSKNLTKLQYREILRIRRQIGFSFQQPLLLPYMKALDNVLLSSNINKKEVIELLNYMGLGKRLKHKPGQLSEGEKKRIDLARALAKKPKILIVDEPFSNLDPDCIEKISEIFNNFVKDGGTLIISSTSEINLSSISKVFKLDENK